MYPYKELKTRNLWLVTDNTSKAINYVKELPEFNEAFIYYKSNDMFWDYYCSQRYIFFNLDEMKKDYLTFKLLHHWLNNHEYVEKTSMGKDVVIPSSNTRIFVSKYSPKEYIHLCIRGVIFTETKLRDQMTNEMVDVLKID